MVDEGPNGSPSDSEITVAGERILRDGVYEIKWRPTRSSNLFIARGRVTTIDGSQGYIIVGGDIVPTDKIEQVTKSDS